MIPEQHIFNPSAKIIAGDISYNIYGHISHCLLGISAYKHEGIRQDIENILYPQICQYIEAKEKLADLEGRVQVLVKAIENVYEDEIGGNFFISGVRELEDALFHFKITTNLSDDPYLIPRYKVQELIEAAENVCTSGYQFTGLEQALAKLKEVEK